MPSLTNWTRLEPVPGRNSVEVGLQARVHDPLWMLGRQWQVGEFRAEDAGSPVTARLRAEVTNVTRYSTGSPGPGSIESLQYEGRLPLETLVECEAPGRTGGQRRHLRLAVEAGQRFLLLLAREGMSRYRDTFIRSFVLESASPGDDDDTRAFLAVVAGRAPDGARLYDAIRAARDVTGSQAGLPPTVGIEATDVDAVGRAAKAFVDWYSELVSQPKSGDRPAWIPERMEYAFALAAPTGDGERVLVAREYVEGTLDWHAFDERPGVSLGTGAAPSLPRQEVRTVIPAPVSYRGMPASRWWEFEDSVVDFGAVDVARSDLSRLLLVDFVLKFSTDWFIMPVELDVGSLCTAQSLVVVDSFGERTLVPHYTEVDGTAGRWHLFRTSVERGAATALAVPRNRLFLAPTLTGSLTGSPIEEVLLLRDEVANLAFGVERVVEGAAGTALNRAEKYQQSRAQRQRESVPSVEPGAQFRYALSTQIPDYWIPLAAVENEDGRSIRLTRARLLTSTGGETTLPTPLGRILEPGRPLSLFEEEVPRAGARVMRAWQLARWTDGSTHLWIGRRKQAGRGEGSSGLRFDALVRPANATD